MPAVDHSAATLSNGLFTTAIATYALAMVGYTAEFAFARVARPGARSVATSAAANRQSVKPAVATRELVGAGGPTVTVATDVLGSDDLPPTPPVTPTAPKAKRPMADRIGRASLVITFLGLVVHAISITVRAIAVDAVPWSNMYEFASVAGFIAVVAFLIVMVKVPGIRFLGGFILLPVIVMMFLAGTVLYSPAGPLVPALQSYWLAIHVTLISFAEGALMTSAVLTALFLVRNHHDRRAAKPGYKLTTGGELAQRLPAAETLDKVAYRIVAFAFPLYTVAVICGAIWAEAAWGKYWSWDPKETWAFIVWVVYACYLHARATVGWKGRAAAWVNLLGFACITFNFLVVNLVVSGLHSYAGLS